MFCSAHRIEIRNLLLVAMIIFSPGCKPIMTRLPSTAGAEPVSNVPPEVSPFFARPSIGHLPPRLPATIDLSSGIHADLYLPSKDHLASRTFGWDLYLPYSKQLIHESPTVYVVEASHTFADGWSIWTPLHNRYYVISKRSGDILRYHETKIPGISSALVHNDFLYVMYQADNNPPQYWRIPL